MKYPVPGSQYPVKLLNNSLNHRREPGTAYLVLDHPYA